MKYHLVKCEDLKKVKKYLKILPREKWDSTLPWRDFVFEGIFCTSFKGSAHALENPHTWIEIEPGVMVANLEGLNI